MATDVNRRKPCRISAAAPIWFDAMERRAGALLRRDALLGLVEGGPHAFRAMPLSASRPFGVFGGALLEEIRVFDAVEDFRQPGDRVFLNAVDRLQLQLTEA